MPFHIGLLVFPDITQLDMTGPYEVFIKFPDAKVHLVWKSREPVTAGGGMQLVPTTTFAECPQLDLICVPGGGGMNALLNDAETLDFIRRQAKSARYVTSVCTGALVLGAAGLLKGKRAATHWMSREMLSRVRRDAGCRTRRGGRQHDHGWGRYGGDRFRATGRRRGIRAGARAGDSIGHRIRPASALRRRFARARRSRAGREDARCGRKAAIRAAGGGRSGSGAAGVSPSRAQNVRPPPRPQGLRRSAC